MSNIKTPPNASIEIENVETQRSFLEHTFTVKREENFELTNEDVKAIERDIGVIRDVKGYAPLVLKTKERYVVMSCRIPEIPGELEGMSDDMLAVLRELRDTIVANVSATENPTKTVLTRFSALCCVLTTNNDALLRGAREDEKKFREYLYDKVTTETNMHSIFYERE
jgi:hypothetical protein